jgi:hypothetical protein
MSVMLLYPSHPQPCLVGATVARVDGDEIEVTLAGDVALPAGARLIVEGPRGTAEPRVIAHVIERAGSRVRLRSVRVARPDAREYPRVLGRVPFRYGPSPGPEAAAAWMRGEPVAGADRAPDPLVNFSATGLAFDDTLPGARPDDRLLMELSVPQEGGPWRCVAKVVRVIAVPEEERDVGEHRIAVFFETIPTAATEALARYTVRMQDLLLEREGGPEN